MHFCNDMWLHDLGLIGLFLACFLSATIIPFASEAVVLFFLASGYNAWTILIIATTGNTAGSVLNYFLGRIGKRELLERQFNSQEKKEKFFKIIAKYGAYIGLFAWIPIIGDPLTIVLGYFRVSFLRCLFWIFLGKLTRYLIIIYSWDYLI